MFVNINTTHPDNLHLKYTDNKRPISTNERVYENIGYGIAI